MSIYLYIEFYKVIEVVSEQNQAPTGVYDRSFKSQEK
jgi:hypothetical protein